MMKLRQLINAVKSNQMLQIEDQFGRDILYFGCAREVPRELIVVEKHPRVVLSIEVSENGTLILKTYW